MNATILVRVFAQKEKQNVSCLHAQFTQPVGVCAVWPSANSHCHEFADKSRFQAARGGTKQRRLRCTVDGCRPRDEEGRHHDATSSGERCAETRRGDQGNCVRFASEVYCTCTVLDTRLRDCAKGSPATDADCLERKPRNTSVNPCGQESGNRGSSLLS